MAILGPAGVPTETRTDDVTIQHKLTKWMFRQIGVRNGEVLGPAVGGLNRCTIQGSVDFMLSMKGSVTNHTRM